MQSYKLIPCFASFELLVVLLYSVYIGLLVLRKKISCRFTPLCMLPFFVFFLLDGLFFTGGASKELPHCILRPENAQREK